MIASTLDLQLAAVPCQNLGLCAGEAVCLAGGQFGAVAFSGARQNADLDGRLGDAESPF